MDLDRQQLKNTIALMGLILYKVGSPYGEIRDDYSGEGNRLPRAAIKAPDAYFGGKCLALFFL